MNRMILVSWPLFSIYLLSQPWLSNYVNNSYFDYSAEYDVFERNGTLQEGAPFSRPGMCDTPAKYIHCTDGQDFAALAMKARGKAVGCGCGEGFLGEGLCPMTSYGFTLSDFVSTEPGIALMLGLGFFPLLGTWKNTLMINALAKPSKLLESLHVGSMALFQVSYILWGVASCCIFPTAHAVLTVLFLGGFLAHWMITALICVACMGVGNIEALVTLWVASASIAIITLGAIPRILLTLNVMLGTTWFWNLNYSYGSYAFWAAEAGGLTWTFGAYPLIVLIVHCFPQYSEMGNAKYSREEQAVFALVYSEQLGSPQESQSLSEPAPSAGGP